MAKKKKAKNGDSLTFKELIQTIVWAIKLNLKISKSMTIGLILMNIFTELENLAYSFMFGYIIDKIILVVKNDGYSLAEILPQLAIFFIYEEVSGIFYYLRSYFRTKLQIIGKDKIRMFTFDKVLELGIQTLEDPKNANKLHRTTENIGELRYYMDQLARFIANIVKLFATGLLVFSISLPVAILIILTTIPKFIVHNKFIRMDWKIYKDNTENLRKANRSANFLLDTAPLNEITVSNASRFFSDRFIKTMTLFNNATLSLRRKWDFIDYFVSMFNDLALFYGFIQVFVNLGIGVITIGTTTFHLGIMRQFRSSISGLSADITDIYERSTRFKEARAFMSMKSSFVDGDTEMEALTSGPSIDIKKLTFKYPKAKSYVINNLNLKIKPGEKIAIVGHNGAGKTTLVKLIARLYSIDKGKIFVNKKDLTSFNVASWHKNIGVLFQDYNFYRHLTARENILIGDINKKIDEKAIIEAAQMADAKEFINEFPKKFEQILDETFKGGIRPSTGQKQKIAIARFFYRNSPVVIFDEPTAAIDAVAEYNIFNRIYEFFKNKTVIIISHRFSTVRNADRIIVMDHGKIIEHGNHEELMKLDGEYAKAFKLQAEGYQIADKNKDGIVSEAELTEAAQKKEG